MFDILKSTAEYKKLKSHLAVTGPAALFGLPPAGRAQMLALLAVLAADAAFWALIWWVVQQLRSLVCLLFVMCAAVWLA